MPNTGIDPSDHSSTTAREPEERYWLTEQIADLFPVQADPSVPVSILDITCGPVGWEIAPVRAYLRTHEGSVYARKLQMEYEHALYLSRAKEGEFEFILDLLAQRRGYESYNIFDIVSLSFVEAYTPTEGLHKLVQHLVPLCRAGGLLRWEEGGVPQTTSSACTQFFALATQALAVAKRGFTPLERRQDLMSVMWCYLRDAGCQPIRPIPWRIDVSAGTPVHYDFVRQMRSIVILNKLFLLEMGVATEGELEELLFQMEAEFKDGFFHGTCLLYTVWAKVGA